MALVKYIIINPYGGVPKYAVENAFISTQKVSGDKQNDLKHHGGFSRAVCLYSFELICSLQKEGHPIKPGSTGENITVEGLNWSLMKEGLKLAIGNVEIELTGPAAPCKTIANSFKEGKFIRISEKTHPQSSRWYAKVLKEGVVYKNDSVALL